MRHLIAGIGLFSVVAACSADLPEVKEPPVLTVLTPTRSTVRDGAGPVTVTGRVTPSELTSSPVTGVTVNGVVAQLNPDGSFSAQVDVAEGASFIQVRAKDVNGGEAVDTRTIHAGGRVAINSTIEDGINIALSDDAFKVMSEVTTSMLKNTEMSQVVAARNPMLDAGTDNGVEDCNFARANVLDVNMSDVGISLVPYNGGLTVTAVLDNVAVPMYAWWEALCVDGSANLTVKADRIFFRASIGMEAGNGKFDVSLDEADVDLDNLRIEGGGFPGSLMDLFTWDAMVSNLVEVGMERFMDPALNAALTQMVEHRTMELFGKKIDIGLAPSAIDFNTNAAWIKLNSNVFVQGTEASPGFIATRNDKPTLVAGNGFEIAVADDTINQLLAGFHELGGLKATLPLDGTFDSAAVETTMAPMVTANTSDGTMKLLVGDMKATLSKDSVKLAQLAVNIEISLKVGGAETGAKIHLEEPVVHIDVVTDEVPNVTGLQRQDLSAVLKVVASHAYDRLSPFLGYIPVPTLAGVELTNLAVGGHNGFVTISAGLRKAQ